MEINDTASYREDMITFSEGEIAVIKEALHTKLFRSAEPEAERVAKFQAMVTKLAEVFGIPEPTFHKDPGDEPGGGRWNQEDNSIHVKRFSLTTTLTCIGVAVLFHKYGEEIQAQQARAMAAMMAGEQFSETRVGFDPLAFGLSAFKQAAPRMFETAKNAGRLFGTSVEYTDNGRIPLERMRADEPESVDGGVREDATPPAPSTGTDTLPGQRPDIDPENRTDRGNGLGED